MRALQGAENSLVAVPESRVVDALSPPTPILLSNLQHPVTTGGPPSTLQDQVGMNKSLCFDWCVAQNYETL